MTTHLTGITTASFPTEFDNGNVAASATIDFAAHQNHKLTLTGDAAITFGAPRGTGHFQLKVVQDGTGNRTATWPNALWPSGMVPNFGKAAGDIDLVGIYYDGTSFFASMIGKKFS